MLYQVIVAVRIRIGLHYNCHWHEQLPHPTHYIITTYLLRQTSTFPRNVYVMFTLCVRLFHRPNVVAIGLLVGYETWLAIGSVAVCVIGGSKFRLGNPSHTMHYGLTWPIGISAVFKGHWQSPYTAITGGNLPTVSAVQGDCERVWFRIICMGDKSIKFGQVTIKPNGTMKSFQYKILPYQ